MMERMGRDMLRRYKDVVGWIGLVLLQSVNIPPTIATLQGNADVPLSMPIMALAGLCCFMVRAAYDKDALYIVGNGIGIASSALLIVVTVFA